MCNRDLIFEVIFFNLHELFKVTWSTDMNILQDTDAFLLAVFLNGVVAHNNV